MSIGRESAEDLIVKLKSGIKVLHGFSDFREFYDEEEKKKFENFVSALNKLVNYVENEIDQTRKSKKSNQEIGDSHAFIIAQCAETLVSKINESLSHDLIVDCLSAIGDFERTLLPVSSKLSHAGKIIAAVVIAATVAVACAVAGAIIGALLTSWSGPGAALGAFTGAIKGGMIGWQLGVVTGASALGIAAGSMSLYGFFRKNEEQHLVSDTVASYKAFEEYSKTVFLDNNDERVSCQLRVVSQKI